MSSPIEESEAIKNGENSINLVLSLSFSRINISALPDLWYSTAVTQFTDEKIRSFIVWSISKLFIFF
jgi:hypothetical protein